MLQAHSALWHYLWLAPNIFSLGLAWCVWRRGLYRQYPVFSLYLVIAAVAGVCLYAFDVSPSISAFTWWRAFWASTIIEGCLKFALIGELLHHLLRSWPSIAKLGRNLISGAGVLLVFFAAIAAAFAAPDNAPKIVGGAHILSQTIYLAAGGLIVAMFVLVASFRIPWERPTFGIALAAGIVWCEHLLVWALVTGGIVRNRGWEDIANMGTYHFAVLIWFYYLILGQKASVSKVVPGLPEHNLEVWNRELEHLLHQ